MQRIERDYFSHNEADKVPPVWATRWVPRRKARVVAEVERGLLSLEEACERYALTVEEFRSWQRAIDKFGLAGLRAKHGTRPRH